MNAKSFSSLSLSESEWVEMNDSLDRAWKSQSDRTREEERGLKWELQREIEKERERDRLRWWQSENPGETCCNEQQTNRSWQRKTVRQLTCCWECDVCHSVWQTGNFVDADDDDDDDDDDDGDDDEKEGADYYDENSIAVALRGELLHPRDGRQADRPTGGLEGRQLDLGWIQALSGCHYLSVSVSPSTGLAYRQSHWHVIVWKVKGEQRMVWWEEEVERLRDMEERTEQSWWWRKRGNFSSHKIVRGYWTKCHLQGNF